MSSPEPTESRWNSLFRASRSWRLAWNIDQLLGRVSREAVDMLKLERAVAFLLQRSGLQHRAVWPEMGDNNSAFLEYSRGVAKQVVESGRAVFAHEIGQNGNGAETRIVLCVPFTASRGILGALYVDVLESQAQFTQKDQEFLEMLGLQAASALEHAILYQSAITDPLTGLFTHRHFQQEVEQAVRRAQRSEQQLTLALLDLDHFKELNDTCGHEVGNQCLSQVAGLLRHALRTTDVIARFGGDEFELLLPDTAGADAQSVVEKIRVRIEQLEFPQARKISGTVGLATWPENAADAHSLFLRTDEALYEAKNAGRNRSLRSTFKEPVRPRPDALRGSPVTAVFPSNSRLLAVVAPETAPTPAGEKPQPSPVMLDGEVVEHVDGHKVIRHLGTGSAGEVLLVEQPELERNVALKRPLTQHLPPEQIRAFEQEAKVTASLNHPGVITVLTMGKDFDGRRYYTMKPLSGNSLAEILERRRNGNVETLRNFSLHKVLEILQRVSETLAYAHKRKVVHLDLTPSNIIVGEFGEVTTIDWGSGASHSSRTPKTPAGPPAADAAPVEAPRKTLTYVRGVPAYMSPEFVPGSREPQGPASDVFALGAILYEILTDRPPFLKETTRETLEALRAGAVVAPETLMPDSGIDPALSNLCMESLKVRPHSRPTALEFADRLGRYVRREADWIVTRFGPGGHPLVESDWQRATGAWTLRNGEWIAQAAQSSLLFWKSPVPGAFRFICEAWHEKSGELSLIGHQAHAGPGVKGYALQIGADWNTTSRLLREGIDVQINDSLRVEPGRRYRLEIEYQEDWVYCFVDGQRIFAYREIFPFAGNRLGLLAWDAGAHFRPIEVQRQNWTLQIPAIRAADGLYQKQLYAEALELYQDIASRVPNRLEGAEASLKSGLCLIGLNRLKEARATLHRLAGTPLEPFALCEEARLELACREAPRRALTIIRRMHKNFPASQAGEKVLDSAITARDKNLLDHATLDQDLALRISVLKASLHSIPKSRQNRFCVIGLAELLWESGRWRESHQRMRQLCDTMPATVCSTMGTWPPSWICAWASGLEADCPEPFLDTYSWGAGRRGNQPRALFHFAVRTDKTRQLLQKESKFLSSDIIFGYEGRQLVAAAYLAQKQPDEALRVLKYQVSKYFGTPDQLPDCYWSGVCFVEAREKRHLERALQMYAKHAKEDLQEARIIAALRARFELEGGNLKGAARHLEGWQLPEREFLFKDGYVLQVLLASLGLLRSPSRRECLSRYEHYLSGTECDLASMFLGKKPPRPGKLWPHPLWRPEWRLWLALWLEARGKKKEAAAVAHPSIDPRYGLAHSQPALTALIKRCEPSTRRR